MKTRTTLILLLLAVGLGLWIKFFESKQPNTAEARREAGNVVNFDRDKLEGITIQNGDDKHRASPAGRKMAADRAGQRSGRRRGGRQLD